jgi:UDP:flavonoid glycosyltransferase YjiC (YdhE family)
MKKHILLAWELGAALGHVMGFRHLIEGFLEKGCKVTVVARNLVSVEEVLRDLDISYYQSPIFLTEKRDRLPATHSYSDIIYDLGYASQDALTGLVNGWKNLFILLKPDLVVCDHSPSALITARCLDIKVCTFGTGFFIPPDTQGPILFQEIDPILKKQVLVRYKKVVSNINFILKKHAKSTMKDIYDIFRDIHHFICTFAETDHYERAQETQYYGPRTTTNQGRVFSFKPSEKVAFAYMQPHTKGLIPALEAMASLPIQSILYIPAASQEIVTLVKNYKNLRLSDKPVNISRIFEHTALLLNNASHGLINEALLKGIPSVLLPTQLEQNILAKKLSAQKLAIALNEKSNINIKAAINFGLTNRTLSERLAQYKHKYAGYSQAKAIRQIIDESLGLI